MVEDLEDELQGTLLKELYPVHISPAEIWRYFHQPRASHLHGTYLQFWHDLAKKTATQEDIPILLDALVSTGYQLDNQHDPLRSSDVVGELLVRGVTQQGAQMNVEQLYGWLSLGLGARANTLLKREHITAIAQWLEKHTDVYKALFKQCLNMHTGPNDKTSGNRHLWQCRARLYGAPEPDDAEQWYLSLAEASADNNIRQYLLRRTAGYLTHKNQPDAAIHLLEDWGADHAGDAEWVKSELYCPYPPPEHDQEHIDDEIESKARKAEESRQKINFFRETLPSFYTGPAHLGALVEVANTYLNFFQNSNEETPEARLLELFEANSAWLPVALHGIRQCLLRDDLPSAADIIDIYTKGQRYHLAVPCLAAMELRYAKNATTALDLPPAILEAVAAFRLTNHYANTPPDWFKQLLAQRPAILANVMQHLIGQQIASKTEHVESLYALARDADYATVAKQIAPKLIADFPVKASEKQLKNMRLLIVAMLVHLDKDTQLKLIANKLSVKVMDVAQQVYWLTTGVLLAPELYLERIQQFVAKTQVRASHVFALIHERGNRSDLQEADQPIATQAF
ncbi:MAG: hypothetical protein ABI606_23125, partial [Rhodoferax sp.]